MMAVDAIKQFDSHTEKTCSLPLVHTGLHQPSRSGVTQRVWRDVAFKASLSRCALKCSLDRFDGLVSGTTLYLNHNAERGVTAERSNSKSLLDRKNSLIARLLP